MTENHGDERDEKHLFDNPTMVRKVLLVLVAGCVLLLLGELVIHRHVSTDMESVFGFYALSGFAAGAILVLVAREMRKVVMRSEDYYDTVDD